MEIKIKNFFLKDSFSESKNDLSFFYNALQEFKKLKAPVSVASNTVKTIGVLEKALTEYEGTRAVLCEGLCERDDNDNPVVENNNYKFTEENKKEFNLKFNELLNTEIALDICNVKQDDIKGLDINIACYETLLKYNFINAD